MTSMLTVNLPTVTATSSSHWQTMREDPYKQTPAPSPTPTPTPTPSTTTTTTTTSSRTTAAKKE